MVSVADVLDLDELALTPVHVPRPEAPVRWVATSELVDPSPFLEGGELLLSTGLSTAAWDTEWEDYVARLADVGVVALGLGAGMTHPRSPAALVAACERHGLNLVEVPERTAFVAVSRATARLLEQADQAEAREAVRMQQELTAAALAAPDGTAVALRLATLVDGAAALLATDAHLLSGPVGPRSASLDLAAVTGELARIRPQGLRAAATLATAAGTTMLHPLGVRPRPAAYLAVLVPGRPTEARRSAVRTAVSLLGLATERAEERRDSDRALADRAVELLLAGDARGAELVLGARSAELPLPRRLVVLRAGSTGGGQASAALADVRDLAEDEGVLATVSGDEIVAVVAAGRESGVAGRLAEAGLVVGVGESVVRARAAHGHETAGHALARASAGTPVVSWTRVVRSGVLGLLDPDQATAFATSLLAPLAPELRLTLLTFLKHHGSRLKTAEELDVHRNTVRHRLAQVERLTGLSLDDPADRVSAWVALQALPDRSDRS